MQALIVCLLILLAIIIFRFSTLRNSISNVSAVQTSEGIGIYWDAGCTLTVNSIDWGVLQTGTVKEIAIYVRNEGNESFCPILSASNWTPENAPQYLFFSWQSDNARLETGEVARVNLCLSASPYTTGISNFDFNIVFEKSDFLLGDINKDGIVNMRDIGIVTQAYESLPGDPRWNPSADLNKDGFINMRDIGIACREFGKT